MSFYGGGGGGSVGPGTAGDVAKFTDTDAVDTGVPYNVPFGGDVATPDLYVGSDASLFSAFLQGTLTQDQFIVAFFGTTANRFGALQVTMETTDFFAPGLQVASYTKGTQISGTAGIASNFGDSGTSGGTQDGVGGFNANPLMLGTRDVTFGYGYQAKATGSFDTGKFVDYAGFYAPDLDTGDNTGIAYAFRTLTNGAGNFAVSCEGSAPSRFAGPIAQAAPTSSTASLLANGQISFYLDEVGNALKVAVKYSDGTTKTGSVVLV